ncbi:MAG: glycosyltransferase [Peptostreptococcaceae bacterium]
MSTISLCMIVKDEENVLKRCLQSVYDVVDEIIIVDTGSKDCTKEIAREYTSNIYDFVWIDDFSKARNFSFDKASKDYILWLDADEFLDITNKEKLIKLKETIKKNIDVVTMETHMCIDENKNPRVRARRHRLVKRERQYKWVGFVHEYIDINGCICDSDISIIHDKMKCIDDRNLKIYIKNIEFGNKLSDRDLYYYGKELYFNCMCEEAIEVLIEFITKDAWYEEIVDALCKIGECYLHLGLMSEARNYLYKTFEYIEPRGEILYNIANSFEKEEKYAQAIKWYEIILNISVPKDCYQCINLGCWRFKPHLNLCLCYFEIGDLHKSYYHHKKCQEINPLNKCVIANEEYFKSIIKEKDDE